MHMHMPADPSGALKRRIHAYARARPTCVIIYVYIRARDITVVPLAAASCTEKLTAVLQRLPQADPVLAPRPVGGASKGCHLRLGQAEPGHKSCSSIIEGVSHGGRGGSSSGSSDNREGVSCAPQLTSFRVSGHMAE